MLEDDRGAIDPSEERSEAARRVPFGSQDAQIAQLVEQWTENPRVAGSIPALGTKVYPLKAA